MKSIVATGIIQSGKFQKLAFDPALLRKIQKAGDVLKEKTPVVVTRVRTSAKWYRGKTRLDEYLNS